LKLFVPGGGFVKAGKFVVICMKHRFPNFMLSRLAKSQQSRNVFSYNKKVSGFRHPKQSSPLLFNRKKIPNRTNKQKMRKTSFS
jgi:hypothetical protein